MLYITTQNICNNTFIQQERIKLIKSDSKDIYNDTKDLYFK